MSQITLEKHIAKKPVYGSAGEKLGEVDHDTGFQRVCISADNKKGRTQIGFLHPNGFLHFTIPAPPGEFVEMVKNAVKQQTGNEVTKTGSPPPIVRQEK